MRITYLLLLVLATPVVADTRHIDIIPDFTQSDIQGTAHDNGNQYCGPVAVSNSLVWLAKGKHEQLTIIKHLASKTYMNTSLRNGTGTKGMLNGIAKMSTRLFGSFQSLSYQGWRIHQAKYSLGVRKPQLSWLKEGISHKSAVWLNIGWYKKSAKGADYVRVGGHWVTLVGYQGIDTLVIHDPSPRAGNHFENEFVKIKKLVSGKLTGKKKGLPISAQGFLSLTNGMHMPSKADFAIIDGAIVLETLG